MKISLCFANSYDNTWMVSIQGANRNIGQIKHVCAGVFVRHDYVITSAHCLYERLNDTRFTLHTMCGTPYSRAFHINSNRIHIHREYNKDLMYI